MRTAIITAVTHQGRGTLISGKEISLLKQLDIFNTFRKAAILEGAHAEYREVSYQENDGGEQLLTFRTPEAHKQHLEARAKEKQAHVAQIAADKEREAISRPEKAAAEKANPPVPANEFKAEELQTKERGELLKLVDELAKSGRITAPAKTTTTALIEAILTAKPIS